ncbi:MAG TPA: hypothetical protein VGM72_09030 [Micropepsaceae bacterium]|jgi:hypothetical protein
MGGKTNDVSNAEAVNAATAEAARIMTANLAAVSDMLQTSLKAADEVEDWDDQQAHLENALRLAEAAARLSEAFARVKGELRQTISVERSSESAERAPKASGIAPQFAPNKITQIG